jgi:hypothetical protein
MARSIGDWFADHTRQLPDDAPDDEVVEPQAPWDLQSPERVTMRSERRDVVNSPHRPSRQAKTRGKGRAAVPAQRRPREVTPVKTTTVAKESVRQAILAAIQANPRVDARNLAAFLTRNGTAVTAAEVAAVKDALASPFTVVNPRPGRVPQTALHAVHTIQEVVRANPHMGKKALVAVLKARGVVATKAEVASAIAQAWTSTSSNRRTSAGRRRAKPTSHARGTPTVAAKKPPRAVKISAGAQTSRTTHETPLCSSCGVRISIYSGCRCS